MSNHRIIRTTLKLFTKFQRRKLEENGALIGLKNNAVIALRKEFYRDDVGVTFDNAPMEFCNF